MKLLAVFGLLGAAVLRADPVQTAQGLCDALVGAMKKGASADFGQRVAMLGPEVRKDYDLPLMTRLIVGPPWRQFSPMDKNGLQDAFAENTVATYAARFTSYNGERFEVDPKPTALPNGDAIVHTKLHTGGGDVVQLDYLMRHDRIIDVYLTGSISELAAKRSEYSATLRQGGPQALIKQLRAKTAELSR